MRIIDGISLFCEMLALLLVLHNIMNKRFRFDIHTMFFLILEILLYRLIDIKILPGAMQVVVYVMFCVYLWVHFKGEKFLKVAACTIVSFFLVSGIQISLNLAFISIKNIKIRIVIVASIELLIILTGIYIFNAWKEKIHIFKYNSTLNFIIIGCGITYIVLMVLCKLTGFSVLNNLLAAMILFIVLIFCKQWKVEKEKTILQEREIRVLQQCNESFEHLIKDVRSRQHEFDNQIETIYSLQYVTDTYDELVRRQNEYASHIIKENRFNNLLMLDCSSVMKGFLYYKFSAAQERGIEVNYNIKLKKINDPSVEFDLQEMLGILFDNACEAIADETEPKKIYVKIESEEDKVNIQVENPAAYISQKEIVHYLKQGNSSKGENRGLGLSNAGKIAKKYGGLLGIKNIERAEQNWIAVSALLTCVDGN